MTKYSIVLSVLLFLGCGGTNNRSSENSPQSEKYFSGEFIYFADAAILEDCATGMAVPVAMKGKYLDLERGYTALNPNQAEPIFVEFLGHFSLEPAMEGDGTQRMVVVDSLIGFNQTVLCNPDASIAGIYEAKSAKNKVTLQIDANYSFMQRVFDIDNENKESVYMGIWGRTANNKLILMYEYQGEEKQEKSVNLLFDATNKTLIEIAGNDQLIYKRVYM